MVWGHTRGPPHRVLKFLHVPMIEFHYRAVIGEGRGRKVYKVSAATALQRFFRASPESPIPLNEGIQLKS